MRTYTCLTALMVGLLILSTAPCLGQEAADGAWSADRIAVIKGFSVPESVRPDPENGIAYVTSIESQAGEYWADDGEGFISRISVSGDVENLRWLDSTAQHTINAPKGASLLGGYLYFTDNTRLFRVPVSGGPIEKVPLPQAAQLNDTASGGGHVYISDMGLGKVYKVDLQ